jgi:hypothetical protein
MAEARRHLGPAQSQPPQAAQLRSGSTMATQAAPLVRTGRFPEQGWVQ